MVLHSSICNPWFYSFFGTLAMAIGQLFAANLYTFMSNLGVLIFIITILLLMAEVDKDMVATNDVACFLAAVAQKGDEIRIIVETVTPSSKYPRQQNYPCHEEEKRPENEESGVALLTGNIAKESRENAATPLDQSKALNVSQAEKDPIAHKGKLNGSAVLTNHDKEKRPAILVENETKENANDVISQDKGLKAPCIREDDRKAGNGNADDSLTPDDAYKEFLCVLNSCTDPTRTNDA